MFRRVPALLVAGLVLLTAACGSDKSTASQATTPTTATASSTTGSATPSSGSGPTTSTVTGSSAPSSSASASSASSSTVAAAQCDPKGVTIETANLSNAQAAADAAKATLEAKYSGLKIDIGTSAAKSYDELTQQVVADIAGGRDVDVVMSGNSQLPFYVDTYKPLPLDVTKLRSTYDARFLPIGQVDGVSYMAPFQVSVPALFYNKTLMAKAGLDPESPPTNYTQLFDDARKLKDVSDAGEIYTITEGAADWIAQAAIQSAGGTFITADGKPGFDTDAALKGLEIYSVPGKEGLQDPVGASEGSAAFNTGATPFLITSSASTASTAAAVGTKFDWGVEPMPVADGGTPLFPAGGNGWLVLTNDPCEAAFASELIGEMLSPENLVKALKVTSYLPVDTEAASTLLNDPAIPAQQKTMYQYDGKITAWGGWRGDTAPQANKIITDMTQQLVAGQDPENVVAKAQSDVLAVVTG